MKEGEVIRLTLRLPKDLHRDLSSRVVAEGKSINQFIVGVLSREVGGVSEEELLKKEFAEVVKRVEEIGKKKREEMKKAWALMCFYHVEEKREPLLCLSQALDDFDEHEDRWMVGEESVTFTGEAEVINVLMLADRYFNLKRKMEYLKGEWKKLKS